MPPQMYGAAVTASAVGPGPVPLHVIVSIRIFSTMQTCLHWDLQ
jgi:hypothetical protein